MGMLISQSRFMPKGPRSGTVWVRALNNLTPFTKMSHGGPYQDDTALWYIPHVRNVQVVAEEEQLLAVDLTPVEQVEPAPDRKIPEDWFLEMAITVCTPRPGGRKV